MLPHNKSKNKIGIIMRVVNMTDCAKSEKIEDHENLKFYFRTTVAWPLCLRQYIEK